MLIIMIEARSPAKHISDTIQSVCLCPTRAKSRHHLGKHKMVGSKTWRRLTPRIVIYVFPSRHPREVHRTPLMPYIGILVYSDVRDFRAAVYDEIMFTFVGPYYKIQDEYSPPFPQPK